MGAKTGIAWTQSTWNAIRGCTKVSRGCDNCYAMSVAHRFSGPGQPYEGLARTVNGRPAWTNQVRFIPEHLDDPVRWQKPRLIFVNSMSDLFHPAAEMRHVAAIWAVMALTPRHTYQILTKRPENIIPMICRPEFYRAVLWQAGHTLRANHPKLLSVPISNPALHPLPNVWIGTSVEDQAAADERIPHLLATPAAVRFLSCEPLLGPIFLDTIVRRSPYHHAPGTLNALTGEWWPALGIQPGAEASQRLTDDARIGWVIAGGESGRRARPMDPGWARSLRDQCVAAEVPYFFKQWGGPTAKSGGKELDGREWCEMPS